MIFIPLRTLGFVVAISAVGIALMILAGVLERNAAAFVFAAEVTVGIASVAYTRLPSKDAQNN